MKSERLRDEILKQAKIERLVIEKIAELEKKSAEEKDEEKIRDYEKQIRNLQAWLTLQKRIREQHPF